MQILITDPRYDGFKTPSLPLYEELEQELLKIHKEVDLIDSNIGHGADWPIILATFSALYFLGEKIEKNLNAWISLSKKFYAFLNWTKKNIGKFRVDEKGAILIAIQDILNSQKELEFLKILKLETIIFSNHPQIPKERLDSTPDSLYIIALEITGGRIVIYGIKSKGSIEFKHSFTSEWYEF